MFISFLYPFPIRDIQAPYLWIFYKQLDHFKAEEIVYLGSPEYFQDPALFCSTRWEFNPGAQQHLGYRIPSLTQLASINRRPLEASLFVELQSLPTSNAAWKHLITEPYQPLEAALDREISAIVSKGPVEAILTWCNCKSLSVVAERYGIPVIHNEQGPTRTPYYTQTAYFDFCGVNGCTEAEARFQRFKEEVETAGIETVSKKEILYLFTAERYLASLPAKGEVPSFDIGLALQIEDDSNVIAYGKGYNNFELINAARKLFDRDKVLIRKHPRGHLEYRDNLGVTDDSSDVFEFFKKCRRIATVNSSVGLEAMLYDKPTYILGDSPFAFLAHNRLDPALETHSVPDQLLGLNFAVFGYLIPYEFLFNTDYYRWRLSRPAEMEIYRYHFDYYRDRELPQAEELPQFPGRELFLYALERKVLKLAAEREALAEQLTSLATDELVSELENCLKQRSSEMVSLGDKLKAVTEQIEMKRTKRLQLEARLNERVAELERLLEEKEAERLQGEASHAAAMAGTVASLAETQARLADKEREIAEKDALVAERRAQLANLDGRIAHLEVEVARGLEDIAKRDSKLRSVEGEIGKARDAEAELVKRLEQKREKLEEWESRVQQLEEFLALESQRLEQHLRHNDEQQARLRQELAKKDQSLIEKKQALLEKEQALKVASGKIDRVEAELAAINENMEIMRQQVAERERRVEELLHSLSWKVTGPLRAAYDVMKGK